MSFENIIKIISFLATAIGLIYVAVGYRNSNKLKRGEWLKDLFDKFYRGTDFAEVRQEIDADKIEKYLEVDKDGKAANDKHEEIFVNFLNFFEFIAVLVKRKYLDKDEVKDLFNYYLKSIAKHNFIKKYIEEYDFENFENLLKNYE